MNQFNLALPDFREWQGPPPPVLGKARSSDADGELGTPRKWAGQIGCTGAEGPTWEQADATNRAEALEGGRVEGARLAACSADPEHRGGQERCADVDTFCSKATGTILKRLASFEAINQKDKRRPRS